MTTINQLTKDLQACVDYYTANKGHSPDNILIKDEDHTKLLDRLSKGKDIQGIKRKAENSVDLTFNGIRLWYR